MEEIACPDGNGKEAEEPLVTYLPERRDAFPNAVESGLYLVIYRELAGKEIAHYEDCNGTYCRYYVARGGKAAENTLDACARLGEEHGKDTYLEQERSACNYSYEERVDGAFSDYRAERLRERNTVVLLKNSAAGKFAYARDDKTRGV